jgi:hypothetical protein
MLFMGLFMLSAPLLAGHVAAGPGDPASSMGRKLKVTFWIEFGRISRDCRGFGICDWGLEFSLDKVVHPLTETGAGGEGYFDDDGKFVIDFLKDYMLNETVVKYLQNGFVMEEDVPIPPEILQKLNYRGDYMIRAGTYSVTPAPDRLIVKF